MREVRDSARHAEIVEGRSGPVSDLCWRYLGVVKADENEAGHRFMAKASARVTASGRPSGTVTTTSATEMMSMRVKAMPFSLAVLLKWVRVGTEVVRGKTLTGEGLWLS